MGYLTTEKKKVTVKTFVEMKRDGNKIAMLTAYDYTTARLIDEAGVDSILVGDSASNVMLGNDSTLPITLDEMIVYARGVARGCQRALVVCDMPFGSYQVSPEEGVRNAVRLIRETGVDAVKLEGGEEVAPTIERIVNAGIPVVGHLGLTPQSIQPPAKTQTGIHAFFRFSETRHLLKIIATAAVIHPTPQIIASVYSAPWV